MYSNTTDRATIQINCAALVNPKLNLRERFRPVPNPILSQVSQPNLTQLGGLFGSTQRRIRLTKSYEHLKSPFSFVAYWRK